MIGSPRMDDEIIYSWCFNSVECFDSNLPLQSFFWLKTWRACLASYPSKIFLGCGMIFMVDVLLSNLLTSSRLVKSTRY